MNSRWGTVVGLLALTFSLAGCDNAPVQPDSGTQEPGDLGEPGPPKIGQVCGGIAGSNCGEPTSRLFCRYPESAQCGQADIQGSCDPRPEACDQVFDPVCGCDGRTHNNACTAHQNGVSIAFRGACEDSGHKGQACGSAGMKPCAAGLFCNFPVSSACGAAGVPGVCDNKPEACAEIYQPACGCDGETYANACEAQRAGMSVAQVSECWIEGKMCGGESGQTCDETEYCSYPFGDTCVHADAPGTCEVKARFCPEDIDLVCGCDNKTYANECKARQAGTNVAHAGACT